jgi:methionyl aminopeptidase
MNLKSSNEIALMKKAGSVVFGALELARTLVCPGITTAQLNDEIEKFILSKGATPSFKGLYDFPAAACISVNEQVVHGIPGPRVLQEGDIVSVDIGACLGGYHGDAARTFPVGKVSPEVQRLIEITEKSFWDGIAQARVGKRLGDISHAIQTTAEAAGYGVVRELIGHGIGTEIHQPPDVPNYGKPGHGWRLEPGLTIAVEPMINQGTRRVYQLDDGWTIVTADGAYSAHYENTIAITDGEPEILTMC